MGCNEVVTISWMMAAPAEFYTLSLHDALPIFVGTYREAEARLASDVGRALTRIAREATTLPLRPLDRKSTRLNSSHPSISFAVFCLKKKTALPRGAARLTVRALLPRPAQR